MEADVRKHKRSSDEPDAFLHAATGRASGSNVNDSRLDRRFAECSVAPLAGLSLAEGKVGGPAVSALGC